MSWGKNDHKDYKKKCKLDIQNKEYDSFSEVAIKMLNKDVIMLRE